MYFCEDVDLMVWEPGVFGETAFGHQSLVQGAAGTLTATALVTGAGTLGAVVPGMVAIVETAGGMGGGGLTQLMEVVAVADASHATLSALRGRGDEAAIAGLAGGSVTVTVMSFRPQIAAVGDELLGLLGVASDRTAAGELVANPKGFRTACVFGVLAAIFRVLAQAAAEAETLTDGGTTGVAAASATAAKRDFYVKLYAEVRHGVSGTVEGRAMRGGVGMLARA